MSEIYISVDVETDGPIPGPHSMLSLGAVALKRDKKTNDFETLGTFSTNLETIEGASPDRDTANWWLTQPEAWEACRKDLENPTDAMCRFNDWLDSFGVKPVFVGYPAGFDHMFCYWYQIKYTGRSPFSFSALDIKTFGMATMGIDYRDVTKRSMKPYLGTARHTHVAVDDAIEQGELFCNLYRANARK